MLAFENSELEERKNGLKFPYLPHRLLSIRVSLPFDIFIYNSELNTIIPYIPYQRMIILIKRVIKVSG